jgi:hypothetical protein
MRSFAGLYNPQVRLRVALASIAFTATAISLLLALASVSLPQPKLRVPRTIVQVPIASAPAQQAAVSRPTTSMTQQHQPSLLWNLLIRWVFIIDAIAVLGFLAVARMWRR